jgi:exo-beta-1,3-glucanase (GH17 family)/cellulose synthase/poly-beta-1,6-N-acetylglucosamine synthase-like glycosyltransferase
MKVGKGRWWPLTLALGSGLINVIVWWLMNWPVVPIMPNAQHFDGKTRGLAYSGYGRFSSPSTVNTQNAPDKLQATPQTAQRFSPEGGGHSARLLAYTTQVRTYGLRDLQQLAADKGFARLRITAGVWLDARQDNNLQELHQVLKLARQHINVAAIMLGNETQLLYKLTPAQLAQWFGAARALTRLPLSTAEPWHVWLARPELVELVDFITVHVLPYWEGVPAEQAVAYALARVNEVKKRYPHKAVVIGEFGWPSAGPTRGGAVPGSIEQAKVLHDFVGQMLQRPEPYFLMEAIDQVWKPSIEGPVGAFWGLMQVDFTPKFDWQASVRARPYWYQPALIAAGVGALLIWFAMRLFSFWPTRYFVVVAVLTQAGASLCAWALIAPLQLYLRPDQWVMWVLLALAVGFGLVLVWAMLLEALGVWNPAVWQHKQPPRTNLPVPNRLLGQPLEQGRGPLVSIHLACSNEPAAMVIKTIDALIAQQQVPFELLVVDNNTVDVACWQPVQAYVKRLASAGMAVRFFHLPQWPGYKAGALNYALQHTDSRAQIIAVVDADYVVQPDWLRSTVGFFESPAISLVQLPQSHRAWQGKAFRSWMYWEYESFFRIGMHHRHQHNAIIQHGTMTMVRKQALLDVGQWSHHTVCEDSELGLRLLAAGGQAVYVDATLGQGLLPDDIEQYCRQRRRWAMGGFQIMRSHAALLFNGLSRAPKNTQASLTPAQRFHFVAGWMPWLGDALHLVFVLLALVASLLMMVAPNLMGPPHAALMLPLLGMFFSRLVITFLVNQRRQPARLGQLLGALLMGAGLSLPIAKGVLAGIFKGAQPFVVTRKQQAQALPPSPTLGAGYLRESLLLAVGLACCAFGLGVQWLWPVNGAGYLSVSQDNWLWLVCLLVSSLPYWALVICSRMQARYKPADRLWHTKIKPALEQTRESE